jgi:hypothetical protein
MKTKILFLFLYFCFGSFISYSQTSESSLTITEKKDSVGINSILLSDNARDNMANIFSARNKDSYANRLTIGTEISGSYHYKDYPWAEAYGVSVALYAGNSNSSDKRIHGFNELSHLYHILFDKPMEYNNDTFIFYDPGISFFSKSRKFSVDLYHKLSTQPFVNGKQLIAPYKLNFHF